MGAGVALVMDGDGVESAVIQPPAADLLQVTRRDGPGLRTQVQLVSKQGRVGLDAKHFAQAIGDLGVGTVGVAVVVFPPVEFEDGVEEGMIGSGLLVVPDARTVAMADRMLAALGLEIQLPVGPILLQMLKHTGELDGVAQAVREVDENAWHGKIQVRKSVCFLLECGDLSPLCFRFGVRRFIAALCFHFRMRNEQIPTAA